MEINFGRRSERISMPASSRPGSVTEPPLPLEVRLRRLHQRRRRAAIRRLMRVAFWSAGAIGVAAFVLILGIEAAPK
jgi:hypothetical protein